MSIEEEPRHVTGMIQNKTHQVDRSWFVCQTNAREEKRAKYFLEEKGFEVFLPMMESYRARGFETVRWQRPLFPNYLFVQLDGNKDVGFVRWTQGIRRLLPDSLRPMPLEEGVVESIKILGDRKGLVRRKPLKKRDWVRIVSGPFKGVLGIFDHWTSDQGRVAVLLELVNYQGKLDLHYTQVEKVA